MLEHRSIGRCVFGIFAYEDDDDDFIFFLISKTNLCIKTSCRNIYLIDWKNIWIKKMRVCVSELNVAIDIISNIPRVHLFEYCFHWKPHIFIFYDDNRSASASNQEKERPEQLKINAFFKANDSIAMKMQEVISYLKWHWNVVITNVSSIVVMIQTIAFNVDFCNQIHVGIFNAVSPIRLHFVPLLFSSHEYLNVCHQSGLHRSVCHDKHFNQAEEKKNFSRCPSILIW